VRLRRHAANQGMGHAFPHGPAPAEENPRGGPPAPEGSAELGCQAPQRAVGLLAALNAAGAGYLLVGGHAYNRDPGFDEANDFVAHVKGK
jgi:hypothetical protein